ncbi:hypothetical protein F0U60_19345 [Archangium minus]|uniref:Uncharacterized protein n=1 Tax=Archangium minus TaxID=83450 RepID=A0ABY9WV77_9BACT|nr:hypothetical protein F0U60_19345 [Archangium minus]
MSKKNADTQSGNDTGSSTNTRAMQPRTGRIKQIRRLREKSTMTLRSAASVAGLADNAKAPKQGRVRQLKAVKQLAARLPKAVAVPPRDTKVALARPMQFRQISARKTIQAAIRIGGAGLVDDVAKTTLARNAQVRQFGAKKQLSLKAEAK